MANVNFKLDKIHLIRDDLRNITRIDAAVSFLSEDLSWGSLLNQHISSNATHNVRDTVMKTIERPRAGQVYAMPGRDMGFDWLIYAIMPAWDGGIENEQRYVRKCNRAAMEKARALGCHAVAFPGLGPQAHYMPYQRMLRLSLNEIVNGLQQPIEAVYIICSTRDIYAAYEDRLLAMRF